MNQEQGGVGWTTVSACLRERSQRRGRMKEAREALAPVWCLAFQGIFHPPVETTGGQQRSPEVTLQSGYMAGWRENRTGMGDMRY